MIGPLARPEEQKIDVWAERTSALRRLRHSTYRFFRYKPLGAVSGILVIALVLSAIFAPLLAPHGALEQVKGVVLVDGFIAMTGQDGKDVILHVLQPGETAILLELDYRNQNPGMRIRTVEQRTVLTKLTSEQQQEIDPIIAGYRAQYPDAWQVAAKRLRLLPPGRLFWLGTDDLGRDLWSRIVFGSRISLQVGIIATGMALGMGVFFGILSAYVKGWFDLIFQRFVDALMAFPLLIFALVLASIAGGGMWNVIFLLGIVLSPRMIRVVRGAALTVAQNQYIDAARAIGATDMRVMFRHIMPNVWAPILVLGGLLIGAVILIEASLSFLGVGIPPPAPSWGGMLSRSGREYFQVAWWMPVFPGVAISLAILGWNLLGDALRDVLDPRLRGT